MTLREMIEASETVRLISDLNKAFALELTGPRPSKHRLLAMLAQLQAHQRFLADLMAKRTTK